MTPAELGSLKDDWDSYGSIPPTPQAIKMAQDLIAIVVGAHGRDPDNSVPVSGGGVQVEWTKNQHSPIDTSMEVTIDHDGVFTYITGSGL